ncbi:MAG: DNA internalization-related competence protein ComEC/Rec2 [Thermoanaerobaculia bacterium]
MIRQPAPALVPAALFLGAIAIASGPFHAPTGPTIVLVCLGWMRGGRSGLALLACSIGLLWGEALPPPDLRGVEIGRPVEVAGELSGRWREGAGGPRSALMPEVVRQGAVVLLGGPEITIELAESIVPPVPGSRVRVRGELGRSAGYENESRARPGRYRVRVKSARFLRVEAAPGRLASVVWLLRRTVEAPFVALSGTHPGLRAARALFFGDAEALPDDERRAFRRAGLAHLVAASGMNVALVVTAVAFAATFAGRRTRVTLFAVAILSYLLLVGPVPSLLRASVMATVALAAVAFGRPPLVLHCLALAIAGMLLVSPAMSMDVGFQLSCAATLGLVVGVPRLVERWRRGPRSLRAALATAVAAQVATLPLSIPVFHAFSPASIALNLVAVPLAAILLIAAFVWAGVALVSPAVAALLAPVLDLLAAPFRLLEAVPAGPWISLPATAAPAGGLLVAALLALIAAAPRVWRRPVALAVVLLATNGVPSVDGSFELVVADVGQGEGMLLRHGRHALLVDGGGGGGRDLASEVWMPLLAARGLVGLDAVIATHSHADHCEGLVDVAVYVRIDRIFGPPSFPGSACAGELTRWSRREPTTLAAGSRIAFGGLVLQVLAPFPGRPSRSPNEDSLVVRVDGGGRTLLLTGDLDGAAERRLVDEEGRRLDADVLKVGHHGSSRGTGNALIAAVRPRIALISAGVRSRFGHPAAETVERLRRARVRIYRTDLSGELRVRWAPGGPLIVDLPAAPRSASG